MSDTKTITVDGGCHCGAIRYTCKPATDAESGHLSATKCNCTFCQKLGHFTGLKLDPSKSDSFTLNAPASRDGLGDYTSGGATVHRYFCSKCGTHVWREGSYEFNGQTYPMLSVNMSTVDQPQDGVDLKDVKWTYFDGLHDNWFGGLKDEPWSGGIL